MKSKYKTSHPAKITPELEKMMDETFEAVYPNKLKKINSEVLLQELIKEFELKRKYKNRDKPIDFDGVFLHNK